MSGCVAENTLAMPPSPSLPSTRYSPIIVPARRSSSRGMPSGVVITCPDAVRAAVSTVPSSGQTQYWSGQSL
jgi:hypothetical protein